MDPQFCAPQQKNDAKASVCNNHSWLSLASSCQCLTSASFVACRKSMKSCSHLFLGRDWRRPQVCLECSCGCHLVETALHLLLPASKSLAAHCHFRFLHCVTHCWRLAFSSCSSVHWATRFRKSRHGSKASASSSSSSASLSLLQLGASARRFH